MNLENHRITCNTVIRIHPNTKISFVHNQLLGKKFALKLQISLIFRMLISTKQRFMLLIALIEYKISSKLHELLAKIAPKKG